MLISVLERPELLIFSLWELAGFGSLWELAGFGVLVR